MLKAILSSALIVAFFVTPALGVNQPPPWSDNFENASANPYLMFWGSDTTGWGVGATSAVVHAGNFSAWCGTNCGGTVNNYVNNMDTYFRKILDLSGVAQSNISYWYKVDSEASFDFLRVRMSLTNNRGSSTILASYSGNIAWTQANLNINSFCGNSTVYLWFEFQSDSSVTAGIGAAVDDFSLTGITGTPEMDVDRSGNPINDGGTDTVGLQIVGTPFTRQYTIQNSGGATLNLTGTPLVSISGQTNCSASVNTQPSSSISASSSSTLIIAATPSSAGSFSFNISISNNDSNENPYNWIASGTGFGPEMDVSQGATSILDGTTDNVGSKTAGSAFTRVYTISNNGVFSNLILTGIPLVNISGQINCSASVTAQPTSPISVGSSTNFTVSTTPSAAGVFNFIISINNDDSNENPYNWAVLGSGVTVIVPPSVPILISPVGGGIPTNPLFDWNDSTGTAPITYRIQVSTNTSFSSTVIDQNGISVSSYNGSGLSNGTQYFWRVNATNSGGTSNWSLTWMFTTVGASPSIPSLISPSNGTTNISISPSFDWGDSTGSTPITYRIQVSLSSGFASTVIDQSSISSSNYSGSGLSGGQTYYWRVNATNSLGTSSWSTIWSFTTNASTPTPPASLNVPPSSSTGNYTVSWTNSTGATSYDLQDDISPSFTSPMPVYTGPNTSYNVTSMSIGTYYYRVRASNASGTSSWTVGTNGCTVGDPFVIQSVAAVGAPVTVNPGGMFDVFRAIQNNGGTAGSTSYSIVLSSNTTINLFDTEVYSGTTSTINPGATDTETVTCTVPSSVTPGEYYVGIYISPSNTGCTSNKDVIVYTPTTPPPPKREGGSCGGSPIAGHATPPDIFGMLLLYLLGLVGIVFSRRRNKLG